MFKRTALIFAILVLSGGLVSAARIVATDGMGYSWEEVQAASGLQIQDKIFTSFGYLNSVTQPSGVAAEDITIQALFGQGVLENPGIAFIATWTTSGTANFQIDFEVNHASGVETIFGSSLFIVGGGEGGIVDVVEVQCAGGYFLCVGGGAGFAVSAFIDDNTTDFGDQVWYGQDGPVTLVDVFKDISLQTGERGTTAHISRIEQHFNQRPQDFPSIPEPAPMLLFNTALLGLGVMRRKKS